jgi:hypothetical protein
MRNVFTSACQLCLRLRNVKTAIDYLNASGRPCCIFDGKAFVPVVHGALENDPVSAFDTYADAAGFCFCASLQGFLDLLLDVERLCARLDADGICDTAYARELTDVVFSGSPLVLPLHVSGQRHPAIPHDNANGVRRDGGVPLQNRECAFCNARV